MGVAVFFDVPPLYKSDSWAHDTIEFSGFEHEKIAPFSSVMLCEAWSALSSSDRTASVLGYVCAESAVKEAFQLMIEGGGWLVNGVQSPPLPNLLQMLLQHLDTTDVAELTDEEIWGSVPNGHSLCAAANWLKKRATQRNKVVHGENIDINIPKVVSWLELYERLLTLLWHAGMKSKNETSETIVKRYESLRN